MTESNKYEKLRQTFVDILSPRGPITDIHRNLIDNYITFDEIFDNLSESIKRTGEVMLGGKPNPCLKELQNVNKSKATILDKLKIDGNTIITSGDDEL